MNFNSFYKYLIFVVLASLLSCKAKLPVIKESVATNEIAADKIINEHYKTRKDFKTAYIKADIEYKDDKQSQNVSAEIKIQKDQIIMISVRFLGFTVAKGIITPSSVSYYEKIGSKFFEGDYTSLSKWLGTDLDFFKFQNILLANAIDDLNKNNYTAAITENLYKLQNKKFNETEKFFYFEAENYLLKRQEIQQKFKNRSISILYSNYKDFTTFTLPGQILINVENENKKTSMNIEFKSAIFNEELNFPYKVPDGYVKINMD